MIKTKTTYLIKNWPITILTIFLRPIILYRNIFSYFALFGQKNGIPYFLNAFLMDKTGTQTQFIVLPLRPESFRVISHFV